MTTYLERYINGEYEQVWEELLSLGAAIREEPLYTEARAVAHETMRRVKANFETLEKRLLEIGYKFLPDEERYKVPIETILKRVDRLEQEAGPLPLALRVFYEVVGSADLLGLHPQLGVNLAGFEDKEGNWLEDLNQEYTDLYYNENDENPPTSDPLTVWPFFSLSGEFSLDEYDYPGHEKGYYGISIAPDDTLKAEYSGSGPYTIEFPNPAIDGIVILEDHKTTFVNYLRIGFRWGGFPGFEKYENRPTELLEYLAKDLLPI